jgi:DNA processing protein
MNIFLTLYVLQKIKGVGPKTIFKINKERLAGIHSSRQLYELVCEISSTNSRIKAVPVEVVENFLDAGKRVAEVHDKLQIKAVHYYDTDYPENFRNIASPPVIFYAKGNIASLSQPGIAVIGTRNVSPFGRKIGQRIGSSVAEHGLTVISGLAKGCDTAGHVGCLDAGGVTIAIVATPLDQTYPEENTALSERIVENNGCIISEYPVGMRSTPFFFVQRDRLQCGLANSLIVVETGLTGGSWHAINGCLSLKKPLACFAYKAEHYSLYPHSRGNHSLIHSHRALPILDASSLEGFIRMSSAVQTAFFDEY